MRIKMLKCQAGPDGVFQIGSERDVGKEDGEALKKAGAAEEVGSEAVEQLKKKVKSAPIENAAKAPAKNAAVVAAGGAGTDA